MTRRRAVAVLVPIAVVLGWLVWDLHHGGTLGSPESDAGALGVGPSVRADDRSAGGHGDPMAEALASGAISAGVPVPSDAGLAAADLEPDHARLRHAAVYCAAVAEAACEAARARECAPASCAETLDARCRERVLASGMGLDDAQIVDEARLEACVEESRELVRAGLAPLGLARNCFAAFVAPVAVGARCGDADLHCAGGEGHCDATRLCRLSAAGAPCDLECGAGLHCVGGVCREEGAAHGAACLLSSSCAPGLVCVESRCRTLSEVHGDPCRLVTDL